MKTQIIEYKQIGKLEAANRLQEQVNLIEEHFQSVQQKLEKFTSPMAGFESRLNRAMGELRNVERSSCVLDISSAGPLNVEDQLQHCLVCYLSIRILILELIMVFFYRKCIEHCLKSNQKLKLS